MHPSTITDTLDAETPRRDTVQNAPTDVPSHYHNSRTVKVEGDMRVRGYTFVLAVYR
jgi:hypothetical protein